MITVRHWEHGLELETPAGDVRSLKYSFVRQGVNGEQTLVNLEQKRAEETCAVDG